jgi:hypothetical protein
MALTMRWSKIDNPIGSNGIFGGDVREVFMKVGNRF